MSERETTWCDIPVIIDNAMTGLFEMPALDEDPEQHPAFLVTQSTFNLVIQDFEPYRPSLERMADSWRVEKEHLQSVA